jgi:hypothetical protein
LSLIKNSKLKKMKKNFIMVMSCLVMTTITITLQAQTEAIIYLTPKGAAAMPDSLWGKKGFLMPGDWQNGTQNGCGYTRLGVKFIVEDVPTPPAPPTPTTPKPITKSLVIVQDTICAGDSTLVNGQYVKGGLWNWETDSTFVVQSVTMMPPQRTDTSATISRGDSILFANIWRKEEGIYVDSLNCAKGCDSLVYLDLRVIEPVCGPCELERAAWQDRGNLAVQMFGMQEEQNTWQNTPQLGVSALYELKPRKSIFISPERKPCIGESVPITLTLRGANDAPPSGDCLTCDNLPANAPVLLEGSVQYKVNWLKGWPIIPSLAAGPAVSWNQGNPQPWKWGVMLTPEVEGMVGMSSSKRVQPSIFAQANIRTVGTMPHDVRVGMRFYIKGNGSKTEKNRPSGSTNK